VHLFSIALPTASRLGLSRPAAAEAPAPADKIVVGAAEEAVQ
jgi:hypothetical protein